MAFRLALLTLAFVIYFSAPANAVMTLRVGETVYAKDVHQGSKCFKPGQPAPLDVTLRYGEPLVVKSTALYHLDHLNSIKEWFLRSASGKAICIRGDGPEPIDTAVGSLREIIHVGEYRTNYESEVPEDCHGGFAAGGEPDNPPPSIKYKERVRVLAIDPGDKVEIESKSGVKGCVDLLRLSSPPKF